MKRIKKILIIMLIMINILGVINCMENKKVLKEIHLVELEIIGIWDGRDVNGDPTGGLTNNGKYQKYIGKIILYFDWSFEVKLVMEYEKENKKWEKFINSLINSFVTKKPELNKEKQLNLILEFINDSAKRRTVKAEVGEKYYKNGWIESRGRELRDAIEYLDKYPLYFEDVEEGTKEIEEEKKKK
jgi:hypothetical protein